MVFSVYSRIAGCEYRFPFRPPTSPLAGKICSKIARHTGIFRGKPLVSGSLSRGNLSEVVFSSASSGHCATCSAMLPETDLIWKFSAYSIGIDGTRNRGNFSRPLPLNRPVPPGRRYRYRQILCRNVLCRHPTGNRAELQVFREDIHRCHFSRGGGRETSSPAISET